MTIFTTPNESFCPLFAKSGRRRPSSFPSLPRLPRLSPAILGLTGGIACGKSTVARFLREEGYVVLDADAVAREVTGAGGAAEARLAEVFGEYFDGQGRLDRRRLAALVFTDADAKKRLEGIVHPLVIERMRADTEKAWEAGANDVFWDVPLLYESGMDSLCDSVVAVVAETETQIKRMAARDNLSREEALLRIDNQTPLREKAERADFVIENNGDVEDLKADVHRLIWWMKDERKE